MEPKEILDFHRMFFGDLHYGFLLEVVVRTIIVYLYTILLLRFLGKRSMGQLSTLELSCVYRHTSMHDGKKKHPLLAHGHQRH